MKGGTKPRTLWVRPSGRIVVARRSWCDIFWGKSGNGHKKRKKGAAKGLWKLAPLMEIRKERGFPQWLEKSLANDARLFHSSHRPGGGVSTQINQ